MIIFDYSWWLMLRDWLFNRYFVTKISGVVKFGRYDSLQLVLLLVLSLILYSILILHNSIWNANALTNRLLQLKKNFCASFYLLFKNFHLLKYCLLLLAGFRWTDNFH